MVKHFKRANGTVYSGEEPVYGDEQLATQADVDIFLADKAIANRKEEITQRLLEIDTESLRPLRAVAAGTAVVFDTDKLAELDAEASNLRAELAGL